MRATAARGDPVSAARNEAPARDRELVGATVLLQRAAATVDRLWNEHRATSDVELCNRLGEASRDIHRALMTLDGPRRP